MPQGLKDMIGLAQLARELNRAMGTTVYHPSMLRSMPHQELDMLLLAIQIME